MKKRILVLLSVMLCFMLGACSAKEESTPVMPGDFSFFLRWGVYGVSSYDSESGELLKSSAEPEREKYCTTLHRSEEQRQQAWEAISSLDWEDYVTEDGTYDPNPGLASSPSLTMELIVEENGKLHRILCPNVAIASDSPHKDGQALLTAVDVLTDLLTSTPEWQTLPDYTVLFD
jgi:hypothetical protein